MLLQPAPMNYAYPTTPKPIPSSSYSNDASRPLPASPWGPPHIVTPLNPVRQPSPATTFAVLPSAEHTTSKHKRVDAAAAENYEYHQYQQVEAPQLQESPRSNKKARRNTYIGSRPVPRTVVSTVSSLVAPAGLPLFSSSASAKSDFNRKPPRRQLSGGQLEQFLGDLDAMDVEPVETRPRSMSF
jgi:hypothetical protein